MGGIGETTIADVLYTLNFEHFENGSFLTNIRETLEQTCLRKKLPSDDTNSEVNFLGRLSYPNLLKFLRYSWEDIEILLVDEFSQKGSLENHLFGRSSALQPLPWDSRIKILIGVVKGLAFLHTLEKEAFDRDLKPSNILIDRLDSGRQEDNWFKPNYKRNVWQHVQVSSCIWPGGQFVVSTTNNKCTVKLVHVTAEKPHMPKSIQTKIHANGRDSHVRKNQAPRVPPLTVQTRLEEEHMVLQSCFTDPKRERLPVLLMVGTLAAATFSAAVSLLRDSLRTQLPSLFITSWILLLNSVVFVGSIFMLLVLVRDFPFKPWTHIYLLTLLGAYICFLMMALPFAPHAFMLPLFKPNATDSN